ncbi:unnamed protein product [Bursaphelenchus xylophilus]|uniref:(pine wood nematode) hypothetical protein n=1 Tax=Bursaphelenchus xylophilus TaxID=6326 RepID=A0A811LWV8_BURXY|nr:unnamed protein product [Bursaphelenchus xylophilus]CAG9126017.1 unnamed protein product [Bursaphelenchus xylophilus]
MSAETSERERDTLQPGDYVLMRKLTGVKPTLARLRKGATITVDNLTFKADPLLGKKFGVCTAQNGLLGPEPTDVAKDYDVDFPASLDFSGTGFLMAKTLSEENFGFNFWKVTRTRTDGERVWRGKRVGGACDKIISSKNLHEVYQGHTRPRRLSSKKEKTWRKRRERSPKRKKRNKKKFRKYY